MSQRRGIVTDQLANIIQVIQLGKKTGRLIAERGEGTQREEGVLLFEHGQVTEASCGQMHGQAALGWLHSWGQCRFVFEATDTERLLQYPESERKNDHPSARPPQGLFYQRKPNGATAFAPGGQGTTQFSSAQDTGPYPVQPIQQGNGYRSPSGRLSSGQYPAMPAAGGRTDALQTDRFPAFQMQSPTSPTSRIPQRLSENEASMRLLTQAGLSRLHLRLYLLIDGRRNIIELLRLTGRSLEEVEQLLHDLKRLGIIHY